MEQQTSKKWLIRSRTLPLGLLLASTLILSACAAAGGAPFIAKEALCAVHNSSQMINLCEDPVRK
jgi:hypothetical protein